MQPLISVIVPIYNVAQYLHQCINSIINQTYKNLEIILVDDGSTDNSGEICDEYAEKDNRIIVIHQENKGLACARKTGVIKSNGEYIGFVDSDDWIEPEMYSCLLDKILTYNVDWVDSCHIKKLENGSSLCTPYREKESLIDISNKKLHDEFLYKFCSLKFQSNDSFFCSLWSKLFKKEVIKEAVKNIEEYINNGEDLIIMLYVIQFSKKILLTNNYNYNYRIRAESISHKKNPNNIIIEMINLLKVAYKYLKKFNYPEYYYQALNYRITNSMFAQLNKISFNLNTYYPIHKYDNQYILDKKNIILYGAGDVGISYYNYHKNDMNIVCWADKNYQHLTDYPVKIESPDNILNYNFDYLLIAVLHENLANSIKQDLISRDIPEEKILWSKPESTLDWLL